MGIIIAPRTAEEKQQASTKVRPGNHMNTCQTMVKSTDKVKVIYRDGTTQHPDKPNSEGLDFFMKGRSHGKKIRRKKIQHKKRRHKQIRR